MPSGVLAMVAGYGETIGEKLINDKRIDIVSFTGSTKVGRRISECVNRRFGKTILELGGNNACIVMDDADLNLALKACTFAAVGTSG